MDFTAWTQATGNLSWGAQNVIHDSLSLAAEGKVTIVYGQDYVDGKPCLINSVGQMLEQGGGNGIPSRYFSDLVGEFDRLNRKFFSDGVNTEHNIMSPLAAEILVHNFGELKPEPPIVNAEEAPTELPGHREIIPEASDDDLMESWMQAITVDNAPAEVIYEGDIAEDTDFDAMVEAYNNTSM